ncbi:hypothetical protein [uncultured Ruminococcus sp.]|uniref:hypothetical protein n=1 Tax=uncultured Ruminococcus sp. TaxID=165186 RepID=UPI0025F68448|nr:hypothetical protein [uncultured Ruminococcus sp.]
MVKSESKKSKAIIISLIIFIFVLVCVSAALAFVVLNNTDNEQNQAQQGVVFDGNAYHYEETIKDENSGSNGIKIPGYPDITFTSDSTDFPITLLNPEGNPCNFKFTLSLKETGEEICATDLVKPGDAISGVKLKNTIAKGEYTLLIDISTFDSESGGEMNGAQVQTKLTVE